jgi:hypothetical protein
MGTSDEGFRKVGGWAATEGRWSFEGATAHYLEPKDPAVLVGSVHTDVRGSDITVRLKVTFKTIPEVLPDAAVPKTAAGVILGIGGTTRPDAVVALGGWGAAYSLSQFKAGTGYIPRLLCGSLANLEAERQYLVEVIQRGQTVALSVDNVRVFDAIVPEPFVENQLGLRAWGADSIDFSDVEVHQTQPSLFVAMQFSEPYDALYKEVIEPKGREAGFDVIRIDDLKRPGIIFQDIQQALGKATAVVAEISAANNNVFYELGYAHALHKPTILLARRGQELPLDIRSYRVIFYNDTIGGRTDLEETLGKHLAAVLGET